MMWSWPSIDAQNLKNHAQKSQFHRLTDVRRYREYLRHQNLNFQNNKAESLQICCINRFISVLVLPDLTQNFIEYRYSIIRWITQDRRNNTEERNNWFSKYRIFRIKSLYSLSFVKSKVLTHCLSRSEFQTSLPSSPGVLKALERTDFPR